MGKGVEARFSMVDAHAALPHATEGEAAHSQVDHRVVDAAAAETQGAQDPPFRLEIGRASCRERV